MLTKSDMEMQQSMLQNERYNFSCAQQRIWFGEQNWPGTPFANLGFLVRFEKTVDLCVLESALHAFLKRHDALRLQISAAEDADGAKNMQYVARFDPVRLERLDFSGPGSEEKLLLWCEAEVRRPFTLHDSPLCRFALLKLPDEKCACFVKLHHLIADGWTMGLLIQEIRSETMGSPVPEGAPSYIDYIADELSYLSSAAYQDDRAFWLAKLAGLPVSSDLHLSPKRKTAISSSRRQISFPASLRNQIREFCRAESTTVFRLCLAALYVYMARTLDRYDVTIAVFSHGRTTPLHKRMAGMAVGTFPMRIRLAAESSFRELLTTLHEDLREILASHQRYPFEDIVRDLRKAGGEPGSFASVCVVGHPERYPDDLTVTYLDNGHEASALALHVFTDGNYGGGSIDLTLDYRTELFSAEEITALQCALLTILEQVTRGEGALQPIASLNLLPPEEKHRILVEWNATDTPFPAAAVHQLFETQAEQYRDATAVVCDDKTLTYGELNARANRLAHTLISRGLTPEDLVGIALDRSPAMIVALLATLKAGGAYLPLDPGYPEERLAYMLEDSGAKILITQECLRDRLPAFTGYTLCTDTEQENIGQEPCTNLCRTVSPQHLAYLIYTSGSTGKPKGVAVEHGGLSNLAWAQKRVFGITPKSRVLQFASISFDASIWEIVMSLCFGAQLHLPTTRQRQPGAPLWEYLAASAVTHLTLPPTALSVMPREPLPELECLIVAGEPCSPALAAYWSKGRRFFNAYGPTETTVCATIAECRCEDIDTAGSLPIGYPLANTRIYILDRQLQPVPAGVPGELHIGGAGLARGYLNRPELTAEKFIPDPFSSLPGDRLYKTGDLARYLSGGNIEFLGRIDHQVKIRGFRVEPGEIEAALTRHPAIRESVVIVRENESGDKRIIAYVVANVAQPAVTELRDLLKISLPDYMLPSVFVFLPALPFTHNGKVDRNALPEPQGAESSGSAPPRDTLEDIIAGLWGTLLNLETPGIHDNFFELGGHSLLAIQLTSRLREVLGITVPGHWLFEAPTISGLAARIRVTIRDQKHDVPIPDNRILPGVTRITPEHLPLLTLSQSDIDMIVHTVEGGAPNVQDIYPLAPLQEGILFHHLLQAAGDSYLGHVLLAVDSRSRVEALVSALQTVLDRHDILRTAFVWEQLPEPVQIVWRNARLPVETRYYDPAKGPVAEQLLHDNHPRHTRIDLTRVPLIRIILTEENDRWLLLCLFHHLIVDHTNLEVMLEEITSCLRGETAALAPAVPFRNFVVQVRANTMPEEDAVFFRAMLHDVELPTAPFGLLEIQSNESVIVETHAELPDELAHRIRREARRLGATPAALFHLAWALFLTRCCNQDNVVFGTVLLGRMQGWTGVERALGLFINTLPFKITCDTRSVIEVARETQQQLLALMRHEHASLSLAQRCSAIVPPAPLFSTLLNYRHTPYKKTACLEGVELLGAEERTNYPLVLSVDDTGDGFSLTVQVDTAADPNRLCAYLREALASIVEALETAPETPLSRLCLLSAAEQQRLVSDWNDTAAPLPVTSVHELFEAEAKATPDAVAVVFGRQTLSYAELNARANRLAHYLITLGVSARQPVAIALERSPEMIVALLAILKAGGAYLPLDPEYPEERLACICEDSGVRTLITGEPLKQRLPKLPQTICIDADWPVIACQPSANPALPCAPESLAYIIYTSGSTGKPKGVAMPHAPLCNLITWQLRNTPGIRGNTLQYTTISFDVSFQEIFCTLSAGGCLFMVENDLRRDSSQLLGFINKHSVERLFMPFVALADLCETAVRIQLFPRCIQALFTAGEQLRITPAIALFFEKTGATLHNHYGPTETHVATAFDLGRDTALWPLFPPIGRPIANTRIYILDRHLQPVPSGVPGELHIGGAGLAHGYLNRPELTAEKFIPDPFSPLPGDRLYKTGDLARYLSDGNIEFLGRIDHQVKIRGFRIEPGEIEAALTSHPGIRESVVIARAGDTGDKRLLAYLIADGEPPAVAELREFLKGSLPDYMLPAAFVFLAAFPLTPSGKVDRNALPEPEGRLASPGYLPPRDILERQLAEIWESILAVRPIGIEDNFFELGGHSLLAVRLVASINREFGQHIPVSRLFESPTITGIASLLRKAGNMPEASCLVRITPPGKDAPLFFLPGAGSLIGYLYPLAGYLHPDIPLVTFQSQGLDGKSPPHTDIHEMAAHYVALLLQEQPVGPYYLAGHSFGAIAAFEMARILVSNGHEIGRLIIVDTPAPGAGYATDEKFSDDVWLMVIIGQLLSLLFDRDISLELKDIEGLSKQEQLVSVARTLAEAHLLPEDDVVDHLSGILNVFTSQLSMQNQYAPEGCLPVPITLFRATEALRYLQAPDSSDQDFGWGRYSQCQVTVHDFQGNHVTMMMQPHVQAIAQVLKSEIGRKYE